MNSICGADCTNCGYGKTTTEKVAKPRAAVRSVSNALLYI